MCISESCSDSCQTHQHCPDDFPICHPKKKKCQAKECSKDSECPVSHNCHSSVCLLSCQNTSVQCPEGDICNGNSTCVPGCKSHGDCSGSESLCELDSGHCAECLKQEDCTSNGTQICHDRKCQKECKTNSDCGAPTPICNLKVKVCSQCGTWKDCPMEAPVCNQGKCKKCQNPSDCTIGLDCTLEGQCQLGCTEDQHCIKVGCTNTTVKTLSERYDAKCDPSSPYRCNIEQNSCFECLSALDCPGSSPVCKYDRCMPCVSDSECPTGLDCSDIGRCEKNCEENNDCLGITASGNVTHQTSWKCQKEENKCVECLGNDDCYEQNGICESGRCKPCSSDSQCLSNQKCTPKGICGIICEDDTDCPNATPVCNQEKNICTECLQDRHCPEESPVCEQGRCKPCQVDEDCLEGLKCQEDGKCQLNCRNSEQCRNIGCKEVGGKQKNPNPSCKATQLWTCSKKHRKCVECQEDSSCPTDFPVCIENKCQKQCRENSDCPDDLGCTGYRCEIKCRDHHQCHQPFPFCDKKTKKCVQCSYSDQCPQETPICSENTCRTCNQDEECEEPGHVCKNGQCMDECHTDQDCPQLRPKCYAKGKRCVECLDSEECPASKPSCQHNHCTECTRNSQCPTENPTCNLTTGACELNCAASESDICTTLFPGTRCNTDTGKCVECRNDKDCKKKKPGSTCSEQGKCEQAVMNSESPETAECQPPPPDYNGHISGNFHLVEIPLNFHDILSTSFFQRSPCLFATPTM